MPVPTVMSKSKIEGLFYMQRYDMVSRHLEKAVWYFSADGRVYVNPEIGFSASELAAHKGLSGTYQIADGQMAHLSAKDLSGTRQEYNVYVPGCLQKEQ